MKYFDEAEIDRLADDLANIATSPQLLSALQDVRQSASTDEAIVKAKEFASLDYLQSKGLEPPADFRITTRAFEPPELVPVALQADALEVSFRDGELVVACNGQVVRVKEA